MKQLILLCLILSVLLACSEPETNYWWTRGQVPSSRTLLVRAQQQLDEARRNNAYSRADFAKLSQQLEALLTGTLKDLEAKKVGNNFSASLIKTQAEFMKLEGQLSFGSRPAYGELCAEVRNFAQRATGGESVSAPAFTLFTARALFFLANELEVPAPPALQMG